MQTDKILTLFAGLALVFGACAAPTPQITPTSPPMDTPTPLPSPTATPLPAVFRVIGYVTEGVVADALPLDQVTHLNYAFLLPRADGTVEPFTSSWSLKTLIQRAHQHQVQVLVSVGGWGLDQQFEQLASAASTRAVFISELLRVSGEYGFDGIDIDWEYPRAGVSSQNFLALMTELRAALPAGKLLSAALPVYGEHADAIPAEAITLLDFVNVMAYDEPGHGSLDQFTQGLDYWLARGVPPEKLVMGVPFYSRPGEVPYRKLVEANPAATQGDELEFHGNLQRYNGQPTIRQKTRLALQRASGLMIWTLQNDAPGDASLLNAIHQVLTGLQP